MNAMSAIDSNTLPTRPAVLVLGVGSFAYSTAQILRETGADTATYLTRDYAHYPPSLTGRTFHREQFPSPAPLVKELETAVVVPQSIDWAQSPWSDALLATGVPIFCPTGEAMNIERERDFARTLCQEYSIPFPKAHVASNRLEAEAILE